MKMVRNPFFIFNVKNAFTNHKKDYVKISLFRMCIYDKFQSGVFPAK